MARPSFVRIALPALIASAALTGVAVAQSVGVTLNGSPISLSPPPQTREGRVFVPLRGVFEQLGATVVYADGTINAQGNGHAVQLHIGSTQATVDGNGQQLDVAPFIIGSSTYVPLRFVSQALGAHVDYDAGRKLVAIAGGGPPAQTITPVPQRPVPPPPPPPSTLTLHVVSPEPNAALTSRRPTLQAQFGDVAADPNTVHVVLDGLDVTNDASRSPSGIVFSPPSDLQFGTHTVHVAGRDAHGRPFDRAWQFTTVAAAPPPEPSTLTLRAVTPAANAEVPARRPTIEAQFAQVQADPNTVRVNLDGLDITNDSSRSPSGVVFSPPSDLQSGPHTVHVTGRDVNGRPFDRAWQFVSGASPITNFISGLQPADDARVSPAVTVTGRTQPNSHVIVQLGTVVEQQPGINGAIGQLLGVGPRSNAVRVETNADPNGAFAVQVNIGAGSGEKLALVVDSTEPRAHAAARVRRTLVVR